MKLDSKQELIQFIKNQVNVELSNNNSDMLNKNKKVLHTQISRDNKYPVLSLLSRYGIRCESHIKDNYFIYVS